MDIRNLKGYFECLKLVFSDHFVPLQLTEEQLISKLKVDKINFELSVGVFG